MRTADAVGVGLGTLSPDAQRVILQDLESDSEEQKTQRAVDAIARAGRSELIHALRLRAVRMDCKHFYLLCQELTRRNIPPIFRGLPVSDDPWWENLTDQIAEMLIYADLQWLSVHYPGHEAAWPSYQHTLKPDRLEKGATYLHWEGQRSAHQCAVALGLTDQQQYELAYIRHLRVTRRIDSIRRRLPFAMTDIPRDVDSRPWKSAEPKEETVKRRVNIWYCGQLAKNKPQRTADFYEKLTGEKMSRQAISEQLKKLPVVRATA